MTILTDKEIETALETLSSWELDGNSIAKSYKFDHYLSGLAFATTVGTLAEVHDHHPDIYIGWCKVHISFTTHDAGNKVTQKDIDIALAIDAIGYPVT